MKPSSGATTSETALNAASGPKPGHGEYFIPELGDPEPPGGEEVLLLTQGGTLTRGFWKRDSGFLGWHPKPRVNHERLDKLARQRTETSKPVARPA